MSYKVFFVEDEIVAREGIRDNVAWQANGFELCGEASDGEVAWPLLQTARPDVLITDIKMPFMDGLQLCKIVRERMPGIKVIILSGHDEFEYAQQAIKLGVTEYLLKPVSVNDLHQVLQKVASQLDQEKKDQASLKKLLDQVEENRASLRERLLLKLVMGAASPAEVVESGEMLGIDLIARCYMVSVIRIELGDPANPQAYREYERAQSAVLESVRRNPDVFMVKKDWEELVLIIKGNSPDYVQEERDAFLDLVKQRTQEMAFKLIVGSGSPKGRITDIYQSFVEALADLQKATHESKFGPMIGVDNTELLKVDKSAIENYLKCGVIEGFDAFFDAAIRPLTSTVLLSNAIKDYILMDIIVGTARFVNELGGNVDEVIPGLDRIELILTNVKTFEQIREHARKVLVSALAFRDGRANHQYAGMIQQAQKYVDQHYMDSTISLNEVAAHVSLSPSHFSTVFSQETGITFKEYLTEIRIKKAKELLRTTTLKSFEISDQIGYSDPHYFSNVFRKITGLSPKEFRLQTQAG